MDLRGSKKSVLRIALFILLIGLTVCSTGWAANRVYLSPQNGSDSNTCTLAKPCRQFNRALQQVSNDGEIIVLDSGVFSQFVINKPVTITAPDGVFACVIATSGAGIDVFPPGASDTVVIRGFTVKGPGGAWGILQQQGNLHLENCVVDGFTLGINTTAGDIFFKDVVARNNGTGVDLDGLSSPSTVTIDHCTFEHNKTDGLTAVGVKVSIRDSVASGNGNDGINFQQEGEINIENCLLANNKVGLFALEFDSGLTPIARISNSTITNNATGLSQGGLAMILSRGNNTLEGNTTQTSGTIGSYTAH
jgi:Right handed beta helix region